MSTPGQQVRAAAHKADFALDLIDLIDILKRDRPELVGQRGQLLAVWSADYGAFVYRDGSARQEALKRRWERWKTAMRELALTRDVPANWADGREDWAERPIVIDIEAATRWATGEIERSERLSSAHRALTGRRAARDVSVKDAFASLGVQYYPTRLRMWRERGAPFTIFKRGGREFYYTSVQELEDWIQRAVDDETINDPWRERVPINEARGRILAAIERSGLTKAELAKRIGITWAMLESYVMPSTKVRTVPLDVVTNAEQLGESAPGSELHSRYARKGSPTLPAIREALKAGAGQLQAAARLLAEQGFTRAVTPDNIRVIAKKHGIPYVGKAIVVPAKDELRGVLKRTGFNITHTAAEFGISTTTVQRLVDKYDMRALVDSHLKTADKQDLIEAMDSAGHDAVAAGALLGIGEARFRFLLAEHGLLERFAELGAQARAAKRSSERDLLSTELRKAVASGETRNELAVRLGMPRTSVEAAVRRLELRDLYNELPYEVGAKARGHTREISASRVPFWHAALTGLLKQYPEGGAVGLAKRLGMAPGVSVLPWVKGKRVPRYDTIEKIMAMAGLEMPDWRAAIERASGDAESMREMAEKVGVARHGLYSMMKGYVNPSEKMLERILDDDFWVEV